MAVHHFEHHLRYEHAEPLVVKKIPDFRGFFIAFGMSPKRNRQYDVLPV